MLETKDIKFNGGLLSAGSNAKIIKDNGDEYIVAGLSLAPADTVEGVNVCAMAECADCKNDCLYTAGRGAMSNVQQARKRKTEFYRDDKEGFMRVIEGDISAFKRKCELLGVKPAIRLNVLSDINYMKTIKKFPDVQFYDYTKNVKWAFKEVPDNYHLTLRYSGADVYKPLVHKVIKETSHNVAVVFRNELPDTFMGRRVIDGDVNDFRFDDDKGVIVGLKAKGKARKSTSNFVVN
jgi:hypothetical protein